MPTISRIFTVSHVIFVRLFGRRGFLRDRHVLVRMSLVLADGPEGSEFLRWKPWRMELDDKNLDLPIQTSFFHSYFQLPESTMKQWQIQVFFLIFFGWRETTSHHIAIYISHISIHLFMKISGSISMIFPSSTCCGSSSLFHHKSVDKSKLMEFNICW